MTVVVDSAADLTLDLVRRVAWDGERVTLTDTALEAIARRRGEFEAFVAANTERHLYGITTRHHTGAKRVLTGPEREALSNRLTTTPVSTGPTLPERVLRTVILTRLTDVLNGTAALRPATALALVGMLEGPLPPVPERGNGEPGDIIGLGQLFRPTLDHTLAIGEGMALVNGSPLASAVLVDAVLAGRRRIEVAEEVFAMAAVACLAPDEHYAEELAAIWRDEHQAEALRRIRRLLAGRVGPTLAYQAPVSFRSAPRVLGWLRRAQAHAEECARTALTASSNNPVFVGPQVRPPLGDLIANGGYHNPMAAPSLDALARSWADVGQLVTAQVNRLVERPDGLTSGEGEPRVSLLYLTSAGWAEEARAAAVPSLIGLGPGSQTDTTTPDVLAWRRARDAGEALVANLATLAIVAVHTVQHRGQVVPPNLRALEAAVLADCPLDISPHDFAEGLDKVRQHLAEHDYQVPR
jgi:histidine ammonia-lyase